MWKQLIITYILHSCTDLSLTISFSDSDEDNAYIYLPAFNWPRNSSVHIVLLDQCVYYTQILLHLLGWMDLCKPVTQLCIALCQLWKLNFFPLLCASWSYFGPLPLLQEHHGKSLSVLSVCGVWHKMNKGQAE